MDAVTKRTKELAAQYTERLLKDDNLARRVFDLIPGDMTTDMCVSLGRAFMRGDREELARLFAGLVDGAIHSQAEMDADAEERVCERTAAMIAAHDYAEDQKRMARIEAIH